MVGRDTMKKTFIKKGIREVWKHKVQYLFLILILGLGVASYGPMYNMIDARELILEEIYDDSRFMDLQVQFQYGITRNLTDIRALMEDSGLARDVDMIEYRLSYDVFLNHHDGGEMKITKGQVIGYMTFNDTGASRDLVVNVPLFFSEEPETFSAPNARECFIERKFSRAYDIDPGQDRVNVIKGTQNFELDVLEDASVPEYFFVIPEGAMFPSEYSFGVVMLPMDTAQELYLGYVPNNTTVNDIVLTLKDYEELDEFQGRLETVFENAGIPVKLTPREDNPSRFFMYQDLKNDRETTAIFPMIIFGVAAFGLVIALRRMIQTHRTQIGIFKALGLPNGVVIRYFGFIGLFIGILGTGLGMLLSVPINGAFMDLLDDLYDFTVTKGAFSWYHFLSASLICMALCLVFTIFPAWRALRIKPIDAIQSREGISKKKVGRVATRIGKMGKLPVPLKLTLRNLLRTPRRTFSTVFGVALALSLFLSFAIVLESIVAILDQSTEDLKWDYEVTLEGFQSQIGADEWHQNFTVITDTNSGIMLPTKIIDGSGSEEALVYGLEDITEAYDLKMKSGSVQPGKLVISETLAEELGAGVDDELVLEMPVMGPAGLNMTEVTVTVSGVQDNILGPYVYTDLAFIQDTTKLEGLVNVVYLSTEGGGDDTDMENDLITVPGVRAVSHISDRENVLAQYYNLIIGMMVIMGLISMILAGAIIYNLFRINAQENRRNYATMKTLGTPLRRLGHLIFIEGGFITIFGVLVGTAGGYGLAAYMMQAVTDFDWELTIVFSWLGFLFGFIMIAFVVLLVSLFTIRYIARINIADVIRERTS